jgi:hypothetical protein
VRRLFIVLLPIVGALPWHESGAQIIRPGRFSLSEPPTWVSGGVGLQQGWTVIDGTTGSRWDLGDATQYGASIERTISGGMSVAIRGTTARVPLDYTTLSSLSSSSFRGVTQADVTVSQAYAGIHVSSGRGLHSVLELGAGATIYSNFRDRSGGGTLEPSKPDADFSFVFGYGLGYTLSRGFQIDVVQDLATSLHQKTGLSAGESSSSRISTTRVVARLGFGG